MQKSRINVKLSICYKGISLVETYISGSFSVILRPKKLFKLNLLVLSMLIRTLDKINEIVLVRSSNYVHEKRAVPETR